MQYSGSVSLFSLESSSSQSRGPTMWVIRRIRTINGDHQTKLRLPWIVVRIPGLWHRRGRDVNVKSPAPATATGPAFTGANRRQDCLVQMGSIDSSAACLTIISSVKSKAVREHERKANRSKERHCNNAFGSDAGSNVQSGSRR